MADSQDHPLAAERSNRDERDREGVRSQQPNAVDVIQRTPETPHRTSKRADSVQRSPQARVIRQRHETDLRRQTVRSLGAFRGEPADQRQTVEVLAEPDEEQCEGPLRIELPTSLVIDV